MKKGLILTLIVGLLLIHSSIAQSPVTISYERNKDKSVSFYYKKSVPATYTIYMDFTSLTNADVPAGVFKAKNVHGRLLTLRPLNENKGISFSYKSRYEMGELNPKVDSLFTYLLPFKNGKEVKFNKMSNVREKYFDNENMKGFKAFQFSTQTPDTICAVRRGTIVKIINEHTVDTTKMYTYSSERNQLVIEHPDGTFAIYKGFEEDKIFVAVGEEVLPNSSLGVVGKYDSRENRQLRLLIYYRVKGNLPKAKNLKESQNPYNYLNPFFLTSEGLKQLVPKNRYTAKVEREVVLKELSKKEKKKLGL